MKTGLLRLIRNPDLDEINLYCVLVPIATALPHCAKRLTRRDE